MNIHKKMSQYYHQKVLSVNDVEVKIPVLEADYKNNYLKIRINNLLQQAVVIVFGVIVLAGLSFYNTPIKLSGTLKNAIENQRTQSEIFFIINEISQDMKSLGG